MKFVSPLLKRVVYPCLSTAGLLQRQSERKHLNVITYHGVAPESYKSLDPHLDGSLVSAESLRRQLRFFKSRYQVIHPEQLLGSLDGTEELPTGALLLTCDDGLLNN